MLSKLRLSLSALNLTTYLCITLCVSFISSFSNPVMAKPTATAIPEGFPQWQAIHLPSQAEFRGSAIFKKSMWITGSKNSVFVSQDGGKTWQDKSLLNNEVVTEFRDIAVFDEKTAIIMGAGNGEKSALFKTVNGGKSWQKILQNTDKKDFFNSIAFWNKQQGLLLGDPVDGYFVIKKTLDGGKSWQRIEQGRIPALNKDEIAFAASGNSLIVGENGKAWFTTGGKSAWVYTSNDYGTTWQRSAVPLFNQTQTAGGYALALNNSQQLFALGGDYLNRSGQYANIASLNQGKWQAVNAGQKGLRTAMSCQRRVCILTGSTDSDISFDAGKSWFALSNASSSTDHKAKKHSRGFYTITSENNVFLAAGTQGKVAILSLKKPAIRPK